jgi:hypothetical protein
LRDPNSPELEAELRAVGVTGFFNPDGKTLKSIGIQCALCHSTVDSVFMPGIGRRLDGWPNRDLNIGAIVASVACRSGLGVVLAWRKVNGTRAAGRTFREAASFIDYDRR